MAATKDELLAEIRRAATRSNDEYLSYEQFKRVTTIPISAVYRHFDTWKEACVAANVTLSLKNVFLNRG